MEMDVVVLLNGNALALPLADRTVQCVVTSPPYWGLRDYGVEGQLGLEKTPEEYVEQMVRVFREVWRVLRDDGVLWLNLGDSYASAHACARRSLIGQGSPDDNCKRPNRLGGRLKEKDLVGIPWRMAFALQADGWWLRSDVIWHKPNPMPESVRDRPTKSHEYVFLLTKSQRYFYDAEAIREPNSTKSGKWGKSVVSKTAQAQGDGTHGKSGFMGGEMSHDEVIEKYYSNGRNRRTVWTVTTHPYPGAHFATFPSKLVEPMVLAGTSARGECPVCGLAWTRITEREFRPMTDRSPEKLRRSSGQNGLDSTRGDSETPRGYVDVRTMGWQSQCEHDDEPVPQLVLDPFAGTGTVGRVAVEHQRRFVGVELNLDYVGLARERTSNVPVRLL